MPKGVSEISQGNQFSRSANEGQLADSATRTFRIILNSPSEVFDIQQTCGVFVGDAHPTNTNIACTSFDAKYEGDSRTVLVATFNYASEASAQASGGGGGGGGGTNPKTISPELRPANWSISTELTEVPVQRTRTVTTGVTGAPGWSSWGAPLNPAGDMYEGLTRLEPMTTIKVTLFTDATALKDHDFVGRINASQFNVGTLAFPYHTVMLRAFNATPAVESWGRRVISGWSCEYTFAVRRQTVTHDLSSGGLVVDEEIGWDSAIIVEGRNVICFDPATADATQDPFGQPLQVGDDRVPLVPANPTLATGLSAGDRARACVSVSGFSDRGLSQSPASEPVALNFDGTPRKVSPSRSPLIQRHQIYDDFEFSLLGPLRLY